MRTVGIWVFGLLASAIIGGVIGGVLDGPYSYDRGFLGVFAGMFTFACARLWLGQQAQGSRLLFPEHLPRERQHEYHQHGVGGRAANPVHLADNLLGLDAAQGLDAVGYQMQKLLPLYAFHLPPFHFDENEHRHFVGDFELRFARNLNIDAVSHFALRQL